MKLTILLSLSLLTGCMAHKAPKQSQAYIAIPQDCVLDQHFTKATVCKDLGTGDKAMCSNILTHYSCVRAVKR